MYKHNKAPAVNVSNVPNNTRYSASVRLNQRIPRNFGPPTDDEPFRYEFAAPLGT